MSIRARVHGALRRVARLRPTGDLIAVALPIPAGVAAATVEREAAFVWDARRAETLAPRLAVAFGQVASVEASGPDRFRCVEDGAAALLGRVSAIGAASPRLVGAVSFSTGDQGAFSGFGEARFILPRATVELEARAELTIVLRPDELAHPSDVAEEIAAAIGDDEHVIGHFEAARGRVAADGRAAFEVAVARALDALAARRFDKVVLARAVEVETTATAASVLSDLAHAAGCVRYCVRRGAAAFVGATPELLVSMRGEEVRTEAVAGTEPRRGHELAETFRLLTRAKDLAEHRWVVDAIAAELGRAGCTPAVHETRVRSLTHVHHLVTPITARRPAGATVLGLAAALHPTPALGGVPREAAVAFIREAEASPRGLYAGALGWIGAGGEGELVVALRSALLSNGRATAFAGAGVVRGSVPELEAQETDAKLGPMLRALGVPAPQRIDHAYREVGA